jgi:molecular chaperone HscA
MLAKAQVLADTFRGEWSNGIPADVLKATIDSLNELQQLPEYLIDRGLQEPVAAAASRMVSEDERDRGMFVVVDVGAGTTDFAVFWLDQDRRIEKFRIWLVDRSVSAISLAGDSIDDKLRDAILEKAHLRPGGTDYPFAATQLSRDIRRLKEQLMSEGSLEVQLPNGQQISVTKEDFEASEAMKEIEQAIKDKFMSALQATDPSWAQKLETFKKVGRDEISVVLTGGGAGLAMVQDLARGSVEVHGIRLGLKKAEDVPEWIELNYPTYVPVYQRLAVALGGSSSDRPELAPNPGHFTVGAEGAQWEVKPRYKT